MNKIKIAIDGPASSGKSTTAKLVAERLSYTYIDTGAMYRAVTYLHQKSKNIVFDKSILDDINIEFKVIDNVNHTFLNGEDISKEIRTQKIAKAVSSIASVPEVRKKLVDLQREMGKCGGVVLDGRDIGTVVFPNAELKIYLVATIEARAKRRYDEMKKENSNLLLEEIINSIAQRDEEDSNRKHSPLRKADDAISIDTTNKTIEEQVTEILKLI